MSGRCVEKLPHSCGTSDALQVFEADRGGYTGYCFSCDTFINDPYTNKEEGYKPPKIKKATAEDIAKELAEISALPTVDLPMRKLDASALAYFGIKTGLSEQDGITPIIIYFPYHDANGKLVAYKARFLESKKMWIVGDIKKAKMFGWQQSLAAAGHNLIITEGEFDTVAVYQALKKKNTGTKWEDANPSVISVKSGATSAARDITDHLNDIRQGKYQQVILCFDKDEVGQKASTDCLQVLPTAKTVNLPAKDANDCLMEGRSMGLCNALLFKATTPKNTRLVWGSSLHEAGREQAQWGLSWPWKGMTDLTRGMRYGETYYLGAGVKMGKSEMVNTLAAWLITEHGVKVFLAKPEEANRKTYKMIVGKVAGRIFHDPTVEFDYDAYDKASELVGDNLCVLNLYQHLGWDSLRADILTAASQGCKAIFIDPITNLVNGINAGETNTILQEIAQELAALALDLDILIFIFCHLKAPESGGAHERGGKVLSHQFAGSRAMMRSCNLMLGLEGNKDPDLPIEQRNMRKLVILEDREFGATGVVPLYWDRYTSLFNEVKDV